MTSAKFASHGTVPIELVLFSLLFRSHFVEMSPNECADDDAYCMHTLFENDTPKEWEQGQRSCGKSNVMDATRVHGDMIAIEHTHTRAYQLPDTGALQSAFCLFIDMRTSKLVKTLMPINQRDFYLRLTNQCTMFLISLNLTYDSVQKQRSQSSNDNDW